MKIILLLCFLNLTVIIYSELPQWDMSKEQTLDLFIWAHPFLVDPFGDGDYITFGFNYDMWQFGLQHQLNDVVFDDSYNFFKYFKIYITFDTGRIFNG